MVDVYQMVTDRIVAEMEKGLIPWNKPWHGGGGAINYVSRRPYSYLNQLLLGDTGEYLSWKQIQDLKGKVKKGAKSKFVVFYKPLLVKKDKTVTNGDGTTEIKQEEKLIPMLKYYNVFHLSDVEGIESKLKEGDNFSELDPSEAAENIIDGYLDREETLVFKNDELSGRAFYSPSSDKVVIPMMKQFNSIDEYYGTAFHELTHSTGIKKRLNRDMGSMFGSELYSKEELVAELGSAMLCSKAGVQTCSTIRNSAAYLQSWMRALKNDKKMIVFASARAEKAAKYILGEKDVKNED